MTRRPGSVADPLWYKDAIIYELHVRCFSDANGDGIGDFRGLIEKLDYLQELGVTCLWLLPFFPSPLKDDGYDIADYTGVHPSYGTLDEFREFLAAAHERGMQVLIELVINHTSDQHPWFQAARHAPPGSPERDFYVWSDSTEQYAGTRVIFSDTHTSNWSWDPEARAYYWHRFFSHQPDLNFDNPAVEAEVIRVMKFWLDLGVDALRLDAIPYLIERDGTNCENLPETHQVIKRLRAALDQDYTGRLLLAEANQWPRDVCAYFGAEDECQMAFHFPLMPRLFMSLRLEDRHPVTEIMAQTPEIPPSCQWGLFLRNHDELTLEMVTDDERDYMYYAYSADPRMRVNVGIRRRLAPLLENDRNRIELLYSILLSFPGTPILYYGDEIGMGDNIYLGDRHGVRTPMQWSADRNAGFSRATPGRLYSPVVMDPVYGYEAINVEAQQSEPASLLNWTRHMIGLRKLFQVFGRGSIEFLQPTNRKILAYLRRSDQEQVLCVANLSRFAQPFELDLSGLAGMTPVEMRGYVQFPRIGRAPYPLTLGPYGFLWLELQSQPEAPPVPAAPPLALRTTAQLWPALLEGVPRSTLESRLLPEFLLRQSWFDGTPRGIESCHIDDGVAFGDRAGLLLTTVLDGDGAAERYLVPLAVSLGDEANRLQEAHPAAVVGRIVTGAAAGVLGDALLSDDLCRELLRLIAEGGAQRGLHGSITGEAGTREPIPPAPEAGWPVSRVATEPGSSGIRFGDQLLLKLHRRIEAGPNPDAEISRYLTEERGFAGAPGFAGILSYAAPGESAATLGVLQRLVPNQGDGWTWMLEELGRYYERALTQPAGVKPIAGPSGWLDRAEQWLTPQIDELLGISDDAARVLGRQTAAFHLALGTPTADPAFAPEPFMAADLAALLAEVQGQAAAAFEQLKDALPELPDDLVELASRVLSYRTIVVARLKRLADLTIDADRIRIHGAYHLGKVLRVGHDFLIVDFEGDRGRSLAERRAKHSVLKDLAGMLRSFSYAARVGLQTHLARRPGDPERLEPWARLWERSVSAVFIESYRKGMGETRMLPTAPGDLDQLLDAYVLDKALNELRYELTNRPAWVRVPLAGILELVAARA